MAGRVGNEIENLWHGLCACLPADRQCTHLQCQFVDDALAQELQVKELEACIGNELGFVTGSTCDTRYGPLGSGTNIAGLV